MQLIPMGLSNDCSPWVIFNSTSRAPRITSLAGAFHTPRDSSVRAQIPAMCPLGGMVMTRSPLVAAGFATLIQG